MITKDSINTRSCLFCASDYHLEMILLPYIAKRIEKHKFVILTQNNLEESIKIVLDRVNLDDERKNNILKINWNKKDIIEIKNFVKEDETIIVINGNEEFIKEANRAIEKLEYKKLELIDCFHIGDANININELSQKYKFILNTRKI